MIRIIDKILHSKSPLLFEMRQNILGITAVENFVFRAKMSDKNYISMKYKKIFGKYPDLDKPRNFNEKNNWRKLNDRRDIYTLMVDKYQIKEIITERVGSEYTFPLLGVWDTPDLIEWDTLPNRFVLKCNHAGGVLVCRNKETFNRKEAVKYLRKQQKINYYMRSREWPYKNVEKRIIAEKYMGENLIDYKNYCFGGKVHYTLVWKNHSREDGQKPEAYFCGAYDRNWEKTGMQISYPTENIAIEKPMGYDEMIRVAEIMSKDIPFVRVDCYLIDGKVYIGEMTFFPWGGFQIFKEEKWNSYLGNLEKLPGIDA